MRQFSISNLHNQSSSKSSDMSLVWIDETEKFSQGSSKSGPGHRDGMNSNQILGNHAPSEELRAPTPMVPAYPPWYGLQASQNHRSATFGPHHVKYATPYPPLPLLQHQTPAHELCLPAQGDSATSDHPPRRMIPTGHDTMGSLSREASQEAIPTPMQQLSSIGLNSLDAQGIVHEAIHRYHTLKQTIYTLDQKNHTLKRDNEALRESVETVEKIKKEIKECLRVCEGEIEGFKKQVTHLHEDRSIWQRATVEIQEELDRVKAEMKIKHFEGELKETALVAPAYIPPALGVIYVRGELAREDAVQTKANSKGCIVIDLTEETSEQRVNHVLGSKNAEKDNQSLAFQASYLARTSNVETGYSNEEVKEVHGSKDFCYGNAEYGSSITEVRPFENTNLLRGTGENENHERTNPGKEIEWTKPRFTYRDLAGQALIRGPSTGLRNREIVSWLCILFPCFRSREGVLRTRLGVALNNERIKGVVGADSSGSELLYRILPGKESNFPSNLFPEGDYPVPGSAMDPGATIAPEIASVLNAPVTSKHLMHQTQQIVPIKKPRFDLLPSFQKGVARVLKPLSTKPRDIRCYLGEGIGARRETISAINVPTDFLAKTIDADDFDDSVHFALATQFARLDLLCKDWRMSYAKGSNSTMCLSLRPHGGKCVSSKEYGNWAACKSCVNEKRLCMWVLNGYVLVLPLPAKMREGVKMNDILYWIREQRHPFTVDEMWEE